MAELYSAATLEFEFDFVFYDFDSAVVVFQPVEPVRDGGWARLRDADDCQEGRDLDAGAGWDRGGVDGAVARGVQDA